MSDGLSEIAQSSWRTFAWRRIHGLACIADGIGHLLGLRFGLGLRSAKHLAKARYD